MEWKPKLLLEKGPRIEMGKRKLLNLHMKCLISSWIDEKISPYNKNNLPYEFQLILQGTRDGFSRPVFKEKCYDIEQTIIVMKIKETDEFIGGYNPVCWNVKEKTLDKIHYIKTNQSFIFKINNES